jgi:hypothetical protein
MDEVLSRNLFKQRYLELQKPRQSNQGGLLSIQKFQTGGEVFTEKEKLGYLLMPVASALLQGRDTSSNRFRSLLGAVGKGLEKVPETALQIKKLEVAGAKKKGTSLLPLSPQLIKRLGIQDAVSLGDRGFVEVESIGGNLVLAKPPTITSKESDRLKEVRDAVEKSKTAGSLSSLGLAENKVNELLSKTGNIPGFGTGAFLPDVLVGAQGREVRQLVQTLTNITLKDRSGAAVTTPEFDRLKRELGTSITKTDQDLIKGLVNFRKGLTSVIGSALGGMDEQDLNRYFETGGADIKPRTSPLEKYLPGAEKQAQPEPIKIKYAKDAPMYKFTNNGLQKVQ